MFTKISGTLCEDLSMLYILDSNIHSPTLQKRTHFHATFNILYFSQQRVAHQYKREITAAFSR